MKLKANSTLKALAILPFLASPLLASNDLKQAQDALSTGDYKAAIQYAVPVWKTYPLDAALLTSRAALELGRADLAEDTARLALKMDTDNFAARILLGNALFRQDKKTEASIVLRRALDLAKNEREKRLARGLLRQISQLQRFKLNGTFGFVPSSNVGKVTSEEKVDLIFGEATITSEDPTTGVGVFGGLNATYEQPLPGKLSYNFKLNTYDRLFEDKQFNVKTRGYSTRFFIPISRTASSRLTYSFSQFTYGGEPYSDTRSLSYSFSKRLRSGRNITLGAVHARRDIVDQPSLLSYENTYRVYVGLWNNKNTTISAELRGSRQISEDPAYMNVGKGLSILSSYNPPATAWVLDAALSFNEKQ